ncbi:MAG: hypothetical protein ACOX7G_11115 [Candidatus Scatomorpha sp.]|jgi:hypothetical protein
MKNRNRFINNAAEVPVKYLNEKLQKDFSPAAKILWEAKYVAAAPYKANPRNA